MITADPDGRGTADGQPDRGSEGDHEQRTGDTPGAPRGPGARARDRRGPGPDSRKPQGGAQSPETPGEARPETPGGGTTATPRPGARGAAESGQRQEPERQGPERGLAAEAPRRPRTTRQRGDHPNAARGRRAPGRRPENQGRGGGSGRPKPRAPGAPGEGAMSTTPSRRTARKAPGWS